MKHNLTSPNAACITISTAQTLINGRTRIEIPMKATLLTAEIAEKVLAEKTKRNQKPQGYYDQTAKDLNEVSLEIPL